MSRRYWKKHGRPKPPKGPFTEINGAGVSSNGIDWSAWSMDRGLPRVWSKFYVHGHGENNARAIAWRNGEALPVDPPIIFEDCIFEDAAATPPRSRDGTAEANLWVGGKAECKRVVLRRGAWMGLWTGGNTGRPDGGVHHSTFEDFTIEQQRIGVYVEHVTHDTTFRRFTIEAEEQGFNVEWWYGNRGSHSCVIEDFDITITGEYGDAWPETNQGWAINLGPGTYGFTIRNGIVRGGKGIHLPLRLAGIKQNVVENVTREDGSPCPIVYHDMAIGR